MYDTLSGSEFKRKAEEGDVQCILAQLLAEEQMGNQVNLAHGKDFIIHKYLEQAAHLMEKFENKGLTITAAK